MTRPYEFLVRFNKDGSIGSHYLEMNMDSDGNDTGEALPVAIAGLKTNTEAAAAVKKLLPGLIEAASQTNEIADLKSQLEAKDAELEAEKTAHAETKAELIALLEQDAEDADA